MSTYIAINYQRYAVIFVLYGAIVSSSLYAAYLKNVLGYYSLDKLATVLKNDSSFSLVTNKTTYKYHSHSYESPNTIKLIAVAGPGKDKIIDISKYRIANIMRNSENKKPIDLLPELIELIRQEQANTPVPASAPTKVAHKQKKTSKIAHKADSVGTIPSPSSKPQEESSQESSETATAPEPEATAAKEQ